GRLDGDGDLTRARAIVRQLDARRCIEVAPFERVEQRAGLERRRAYSNPTAPRSRDIRIAWRLEDVRVIHGNAVQKHAVRQNCVPGLFQAGHAASTSVVHLRVTVENLKEPVVT